MIKNFDKNGILINFNDDVEMPHPNETDIHHHEFVGNVANILDDGNIIVEDGDGDFFEIEAIRVSVVRE